MFTEQWVVIIIGIMSIGGKPGSATLKFMVPGSGKIVAEDIGKCLFSGIFYGRQIMCDQDMDSRIYLFDKITLIFVDPSIGKIPYHGSVAGFSRRFATVG